MAEIEKAINEAMKGVKNDLGQTVNIEKATADRMAFFDRVKRLMK